MPKPKRRNWFEEYANINGAAHYLLHYRGPAGAPVLLFLHGGPGQSEALFAPQFAPLLQSRYNVVFYDQRGAGKTYAKTRQKPQGTTQLLADLDAIVALLCRRYGAGRVTLLGHSWGSVLGTLYARQHPQRVTAFVGVGQVVDMQQNERVGREALEAAILQAGNAEDAAALQRVGEYPPAVYSADVIKKIVQVRGLQQKYKLAAGPTAREILTVLTGPIFRPSDIVWMAKALSTNEVLLKELWDYSLHSVPPRYEVPVFYIMGENDMQTPIPVARDYYKTIQAPRKAFFTVPNAGHGTMMDNPLVFSACMLRIHALTEGAAAQAGV